MIRNPYQILLLALPVFSQPRAVASRGPFESKINIFFSDAGLQGIDV